MLSGLSGPSTLADPVLGADGRDSEGVETRSGVVYSSTSLGYSRMAHVCGGGGVFGGVEAEGLNGVAVSLLSDGERLCLSEWERRAI